MVMDSLDRLITAWEAKKESVVVEGVHLSLNFVVSSGNSSADCCCYSCGVEILFVTCISIQGRMSQLQHAQI
jgi:hypothetical protein